MGGVRVRGRATPEDTIGNHIDTHDHLGLGVQGVEGAEVSVLAGRRVVLIPVGDHIELGDLLVLALLCDGVDCLRLQPRHPLHKPIGRLLNQFLYHCRRLRPINVYPEVPDGGLLRLALAPLVNRVVCDSAILVRASARKLGPW